MEKDILNRLLKKYSVLAEEAIRKKVKEELQARNTFVRRKMQIENPFFANQQKYKISHTSLIEEKYEFNWLKKDFEGYSDLNKICNCPFDKAYWIKEIEKFTKLKWENNLADKSEDDLEEQTNQYLSDLEISRKLLLQKWEKSLNKEYSNWELAEIEKYRKELLKQLEDWLDLLQQLQDLMDDLSFESGLLFDLSKGNITSSDIAQLKKWAEYISQNAGVKQLCDMLGKLRNFEKSIKQEIINLTNRLEISIKDYSSKEEIVGLKIGNDLEHILPQELALLGDPETSILFDRKFVESELMCFDLEGTSQQTVEKTEESLQEINEEEKMGPIIICVDTSGSMSGSPETIAKAVALYIASRAKSQKRDCFLINFSVSIETLDLSAKLGINELINFLKRSFYGGTDVAPAIRYAIEKMNEESYEKSDLLIISDFIMASLPSDLEQSITQARENNNKFYSLSIGNMFLEKRMKDIFDGEWIYNPQSTSIVTLRDIANEIV